MSRFLYLGVPGEVPRTALDLTPHAMSHLQAGEVAVEADDIGAYVIAEDGESLLPFVAPLAQQKVDMWLSVQLKRATVIDSGIDVPGIGVFDSDQEARDNVSGAAAGATAALLLDLSFATTWTLKDNSRVPLTAQQIITVHLTGLAFIDAAHGRASDLRASIDAATTQTELDAVDIEGGWPG
ncbi:DUF4376 domain-containing protein [Sphingobium sufflavum]|uniref:DUF4376 domain-containing protein n=1 Tax=Sphingobium sufflavum TaxID=1129547 RepID=UPI001F23B443|nr:DUF4376 domain-containing protein [Sphingobium sufflavum]MCE7797855.1 DUF4376 domain-containing protein [Sphingobium sufflavum]